MRVVYVQKLVGNLHSEWSHRMSFIEGVETNLVVEVVRNTFAVYLQVHN
jgi:hypothetical protein